jgi:hypothetical protein
MRGKAMTRFMLAGCLILGISPALVRAQPPSFTNLGFISQTSLNYEIPDRRVNNVHINPGQVLWYRFQLSQPVTNVADTWLDIDTTPGVDNNGQPIDGRQGTDTEIVLYNALGNRVSRVDDDSGVIFYSQLSFGQTSPLRGPFNLQNYPLNSPGDGRDGDLLDSTYFLAVVLNDFAGQNVFGDTNFNVVSASTDEAFFAVEFRTNLVGVPEPAVLSLAAGTSLVASWCGFRRWRQRRASHEKALDAAHLT